MTKKMCVEDCENAALARSRCPKHYFHWQKANRSLIRTQISPEQRFWSRVDRSAADECWIWNGWKDRDGYGVIFWGGQNRRAHRVSHFLREAIWPEVIMHLCDQPSCVNPDHLRAGTQQANVADRVSKGRGMRGERHHQAKLTELEVREIHERHGAGDKKASLARTYGVSETTVGRILSGKIWAHLELSHG
jgi:hypothetical protein